MADSVFRVGEASGEKADAGEGRSAVPPGGQKSMAKSVTRHALISRGEKEGIKDYRYLLCGVDTLDLGFYVNWGDSWDGLAESLAFMKAEAEGTEGIPWRMDSRYPSVFLPGGKKLYRYHIKTPEGHVYFSKSALPSTYPNVYASLDAQAIWCDHIDRCIALLTGMIGDLGGQVLEIKPSRCDLCADFLIPGGISLDYLRRHLVSRSEKHRHHEDGFRLETYYVGSGAGAVQCRLYDKAKEVMREGVKGWFLPLWGVDECHDVWRVEFQLRRPVLKQFGVNSVGDLLEQLGGIWAYLAEEWVSLRLLDNENTSRRTVHPWWQEVQACGVGHFGEHPKIERDYEKETELKAEQLVAYIAGCTLSYAALKGISDRQEALKRLCEDIHKSKVGQEWSAKFMHKSVMLGRRVGTDGQDHDETSS